MIDLASIAQPVGDLLKDRGETIAVAESSAGGLICAALLAVPGASAYFLGGGAVYTSNAKQVLMDISEATMQTARAATEDHALHLAHAARVRLDATWGIGESGAAGPTGNRYGDPAGHTCIGVVGPCERVLTVRTDNADRAQNMFSFTQAALALLADCIRR